MAREANPKQTLLILVQLTFVLGGGVGLIVGMLRLAEAVAPGITSKGLAVGWAIGASVITLLALVIGMLLGATILCFVLRPFLSRAELEAMFTRPYVPIVTPVLSRLFRCIYP